MAMLGKQAWRLVTETDSLLARLLRAKYYSGKSFMRAELGRNPSYTWKGIWEAKGVVMRGGIRRVGNGQGTKVWGDPWIRSSNSGHVLSPRVAGQEDMVVAELFRADGSGWDRHKVRSIFLPFEQDTILSMRVSSVRMEDTWCWRMEKDGNYSVRSTYRLLMNGEGGEQGPSDYTREKWLWKGIWSADVLPRVKSFFWQLCNDSIPTKSNLARRVQSIDPVCPVCRCEVETCLHLVKGCGWVGGFWDGLGVEPKMEDGHERVREWVEDVWREMGVEERGKLMMGCWAIWEARNNWVFEERRVNAWDVVRRVEDLMAEMKDVNMTDGGQKLDVGVREGSGMGVLSRGRGVEGSSRGSLGEGCMRIMCDAGVKEGWGMGLGVACWGRDGEVQWAMAERRRGMVEVEEAEAEAVLEGMKEAAKRGVRKLWVESDCKTVIECLQDGRSGRSYLFLIVEEIRRLRGRFDCVVWRHVNRNCNRVAHGLAHFSNSADGRTVWEACLPCNLLSLNMEI
ncbi:uncharacterized protein LOC141655456 [Silene latifolia]|uniref:uncharacterized protein LOC141655456 n=1 Tax=Silene latifolia TaxID=37657 RepID=UPI003D781325